MDHQQNQQAQVQDQQQQKMNQQHAIRHGLGQGKVLMNLQIDPYVKTSEYQFLSRVYKCYMVPGETVDQYKEKIKQIRQTIIMYNMPNYGYPRSHHFFFFLDQFPRIQGQLTYALDQNNAFGNTYPQDDKLYQGQKLGEIVNRIAFTLPDRFSDRDYFPTRRSGDSHNQAHRLLFANQNAKIELDRAILTTKKIRKFYDKLVDCQKLTHFAIVRKQGSLLNFLLNSQYSDSDKFSMLEQVIKNLEETKQQKLSSLQINDFLYFPSSCQQRLHDAVENEQRIQQKIQKKMIKNYVNKYQQTRQNLKNIEIDSQATLGKLLSYYKSNIGAVSQQSIQTLCEFIDILRDMDKVMMPIAIFDFGSQNLRNRVNYFIMSYLRNNQIQIEDQILLILSKLFNADFYYQKSQVQLSFIQSKYLTRTVVSQLQQHFQRQSEQQKNIPLLDQSIRYDKLSNQSENTQFFPLFSHGQHKLIVSQQESKTIIYYNRICKVFRLFEPLLEEKNQGLMDILCCNYFDNLIHGIIGHIPRKIIAKLPDYVKNLVTHATLASYQNSDKVQGINLEFEFNAQSGIGLLWNPPKVEKEGSEVPWSLVVEHPSVFHAPSQMIRPEQILEINAVEEEQNPLRKKIKPNEQLQDRKE